METLLEIKNILRQLKPTSARDFHEKNIGLSGSVVRADFSPSSDTDMIVDFDNPIGIEFTDLADFMERQLKKPVEPRVTPRHQG